MSTFLIFLAGIIFTLGIIYVMLPRAKSEKKWLTVINWILYVVICADLAVGLSFIYINTSFGHAKATSTAVFTFIGSAVVLMVILARLLGYFGGSKAKAGASHE